MRISDWSSDVCSSDLVALHKASTAQPSIFNQPGKMELTIHQAVASSMMPNRRLTPFIHGPALGSNKPEVAPTASSRSEERRVGKECVSTCRSRWSPYH